MRSNIMLNVVGPMFGLSLLLLGVGILAASNVQQQQQINADLITREVQAMLAVEELYILVRDIRHELNLYLRTHDAKSLEQISGFLKQAKSLIEMTKLLARTPTESSLIDAVDDGYQHFVERFEVVSKLPDAERDPELTILSEAFLDEQIFSPIRKCIGHNQDIVQTTTQSSNATARGMRTGFLLLGITGSIAGLVFGLGIARAITRSFVQLDVSVRSVADKLRSGTVTPVQISHFGDLQGLELSIRELENEIGAVVEKLQVREMEVLRSEQLAVVGQLAAGMAHELRNPLMPVKVLVQASLEKGPEGALTGDALRIVNEEIQRLEQSIQAFLDFARPPALETGKCELCDIVQRSAGLVTAQASLRSIQIHLNLPGHPVWCLVDAPQFRQVLLNLMLNSIDALHEGGVITIELFEPQPSSDLQSIHDAMRIGEGGDVNYVEIRVSDNGPGFPVEILPRIFDPFVTTKETGTGLGLSICERIMTAHGGSIRAYNGESGGATFILKLPVGPLSP